MPEQTIDQVPLPDQLPAQADLSSLPTEVLQSSAVESLLQQNQDLMTRLSVNIRRVTDLEINLRKKSDITRSLESQNEAIKEELEVVAEKYRTLRAISEKSRLEKEILERDFALSHTRNQEIQDRLQEENIYFRGTLTIMKRYRRRILRFVRPLVRRQRIEIESLSLAIAQSEKETESTREWMQNEISIRQAALDRFARYRRRMRMIAKPRLALLEDQTHRLQNENQEQAQIIERLSEQISKLQKSLTDQSHIFEMDQARLVSYHEERWAQIQTENEKSKLASQNAQDEHENLIRRIAELEGQRDQFVDRSAELENSVIKAERTQEELEKRRAFEFAEHENEKKRLNQNIEKSLAELEELRSRDSASQSLNRRLSQDLNALRKDSEQLRLRIRSLKSNPQDENENGAPQTNQMAQPKPAAPQMERIEKLLAEIQSGHSDHGGFEELI